MILIYLRPQERGHCLLVSNLDCLVHTSKKGRHFLILVTSAVPCTLQVLEGYLILDQEEEVSEAIKICPNLSLVIKKYSEYNL